MEPKLNSKWMESLPLESRDCVSGYIKSAQILLPTDNAYYNIPSLVAYLVLYYFYIAEYFTAKGTDIELEDDGSIAVRSKNGTSLAQTVYGNILINCDKTADYNYCSIYKWKLQIVSMQTVAALYSVGIGIDSSNKKHTNACHLDDSSNDGFIFWDDGNIEKQDKSKMDYETFKEGDIIELRINTNTKICAFKKNDGKWKEFDNLITNWATDYYFTVTLWETTDSVKIINFAEYIEL